MSDSRISGDDSLIKESTFTKDVHISMKVADVAHQCVHVSTPMND